MEKNWEGHCNYKFHLEVTKKVHESFKKRKKTNDSSFCWINWNILWMDDTNMNKSKKEIMDLIEDTTTKLMVENDKSKSSLFTLKKTLDSANPHHPLYVDLIKKTERHEIFFEKIYTITDLSNRIIEGFKTHPDSKHQKQDIKEIKQHFENMIKGLTK